MIRFDDAQLSRRHCRLTLLNGTVWLADLGSSNGTTVNGRRSTVPSPLRDGDVVGVGTRSLVFLAGSTNRD
jgi:pSer/pThr/pTyr-binding forkhead associated (FHA) protein